jgi:thiamine-phosphate pyrophosphorylase
MCCSRLIRFAAGHPPLKAAPKNKVVCYVTGGKLLGAAAPAGERAAGVLEKIRAAAAAGVDWVQIREKDLPARELLELTRKAISAAAGARVIVNDGLDVALASSAAGVHLGHESAPAGNIVRWCRAGNAPPQFLIGVSCHSAEEGREAENAGVDYVFFGPIFETPSKKLLGAPQGIERLAEFCRTIRVSVIAIGGVNEQNAAACVRAGAAGIAAIRMFQQPRDPGEISRAIARIQAGTSEPTR